MQYLEGHQELRHHKFRFKFTKLNGIYIFNSIRSLAFSLIGIFIPIYFLNLGFSASFILFYFVLFFLVEALTGFFSVRLIRFLGPKRVIILSLPFAILHFALLQMVDNYTWLAHVAAITGAISLGLYWQAYHYDFSRCKKHNSATKDVSRAFLLLYFAMMISPVVGGFIIDRIGASSVFLLVIFLLLLGSFALFSCGEKYCVNRKIDFKRINFKELRGDMLSRFGLGWEVSASMIIWPIFIYLVLGNYLGVGLVFTVSMFFAMITAYLIGKKPNSHPSKKAKIIKTAAFLKAIAYLVKIFSFSVFFVYAINITRSVLGSVLNINLDSEYYLHADKNSRSEYIFLMEFVMHISRAIFFSLLLLASFYFSLRGVMIFGLIMGGVGAILATAMPVLGRKVALGSSEPNKGNVSV